MFVKYQHLERFGTAETEGIEFGECYVFPKIDGTNASVWYENEQIKAGSRNRELSLEKDNAGFFEWVIQNKAIQEFLQEHSDLRLFGEWLVPHSLKTYRDDAWRRFYVFDVMRGDDYLHFEEDEDEDEDLEDEESEDDDDDENEDEFISSLPL